MDTLTHALSGALIGRATGPADDRPGVPPARVRGWVGFWAAAFPDIDFPLRFIDMELYLRIHRQETHSFLLMPLWALLIGLVFYAFHRRKYGLGWLSGIAVLGISVHILGDFITAYGTWIFAPLSDYAPALAWVLVIDPWLTLLIVLALAFSIARPHPAFAAMGFGLVVAFVVFQAGLNQIAERTGHERAHALGWPDAEVRAFAQPFSPFNRMVLVEHNDTIERARINLLRERARTVDEQHPVLWQLHQAYRPVEQVEWVRYTLLPEVSRDRALAREAWESRPFSRFREFAAHPVFYRLDREPEETCVWFTDLRYWYDPLPAPFRHGVCRADDDEEWSLHELRWPDGERQPMEGLGVLE